MSNSRINLLALVASFLVGWILVLLIVAAFVFGFSKKPPELDYTGAFFVFGIVLSGGFLVDFLLITPCFFTVYQKHLRTWPDWKKSIVGTGFYLSSIPIWSLVGGNFRWDDVVLLLTVATIAGFASSFVLCRLQQPV